MRKKKDWIKRIGIVIFALVAIGSYLYANNPQWFGKGGVIGDVSTEQAGIVDFIDCGQGDSALLCSDGEVTLVDTSTGKNAEQVIEHLEERGIEKIDHLVLSHPHEDHIGNAREVLETFDVKNIYMKCPTKGTEPTSAVYLDLLKEIQRQGKTIHSVAAGDVFTCGDFELTVLGPLNDYEDLNDQSIILRAVYGDCSFLFTGDMETEAEEDLVKYYGSGLLSTVLKVGHHGGQTSSSDAFLRVVKPRVAVFSCGEDNSYGHPHQEALDRLIACSAKIYRTDLNGTITVYTDGKNVEVREAVA